MSKKKTIIRILRFLPMIAVMIVIFAFSAMPGDDSGNTSGTLVRFVVGAMETFTHEAVSPEKQEMIHHAIRKAAHFTEFMILGMTAVLAFYGIARKKLANFLIPAVVSILYAASDEFHQKFVPGRGPAVKDVCIDSMGALTGVLIILLIIWLTQKSLNKS